MKRSHSKKSPIDESVGVAVFKAQLSKYLRFVREGHEITILDHNMPVAKVVPFAHVSDLKIVPAKKPFSSIFDIKIPKLKKKYGISALDLLLEDRRKR